MANYSYKYFPFKNRIPNPRELNISNFIDPNTEYCKELIQVMGYFT